MFFPHKLLIFNNLTLNYEIYIISTFPPPYIQAFGFKILIFMFQGKDLLLDKALKFMLRLRTIKISISFSFYLMLTLLALLLLNFLSLLEQILKSF